MKRVACSLLALLAASVAGCGHDLPTTPTPTPENRPTSTMTVRGRVLDSDERPVPGATLSVEYSTTTSGPSHVEALSDEQGAFTFTVPATSVTVYVHKDGYERIEHWIWRESGAAEEIQRDLRLHPVVVLSAGESTTLTVTPDDCEKPDASELQPCRIVRVRSAAAGTLVARTDTAFLIAWSHCGQVAAGCVGRGAEVRVPVSGGEEVEIRVFTFSNDLSSFPVSVTVRTIFEAS